jgi:hypothetical protein
MSISSLLNYFKTAPKGSTVAGAPTSVSVDANTQALHIVNASTNTTVTGTLTASDAVVSAPIGDGTLINGASTAGSIVFALIPDAYIAWTMKITGYVSGTIYTEASNNTTNGTDGDWVEIKGRRTGTAVGVESVIYAMVANGYYRGNAAGFKAIRARLIGATGPTIQFVLSRGMGATFLNSGIPAGSSAIGSINITSGNTNIGARPDGPLKVISDPTTLLIDTHDSAPDTVNTWTQGGTVTPTWATGSVSYPAGTVASASSYMYTKFMTAQAASSFIQFASVYTLDAAVVTGNKRVWGLGTIAVSPTAAVPMANGAVFEISDVDGLLYAVIYSNSVRGTPIALTRPTDGLPHRYVIYYKTSKIFFELDNVAVATITNPNNIAAIAGGIAGSFNGLTTLGTAATLIQSVVSIADPGRNNTKISDGQFPWRTAQIGTSGGVSIKGSSIPGTSGSIAAAGTGTVGPLAVGEAGNCTFVIKNTVAANAYAGNPVVVFEQSDDNVSWGPLSVVRADNVSVASTVTLSPNIANGSLMFDAPLEGVNWVRARVTTGPTTNAMTIAILAGGLPFSPMISAVQQPITKGFQGFTGLTTQDLKDAGRNQTNYFIATPVITTATDAVQSLTGFKGGAAIAATVTPAQVTAGKVYRIQSITITYIAVATAGSVKFTLRAQAAGVGVLTSPAVQTFIVGGPAAVAGVTYTVSVPIPDGMEFTGFTGLAVSMVGLSATQVATAVGYGQISIQGYEY